MSLESGRHLGFIASLIAVIVPVITVFLYGFLILSLFGFVSSAATGGSQTYGGTLFPLGILGVLIAIGVISIVGIVLFLLSMHRLAQYYNEPGIFKNVLYGFILNIVGGVAVFAIMFAIIFASVLSSVSHPATSLSPFSFIAVILGVIATAFAIAIVSAVLYKRSFDKLGEKSGVQSFKTAGDLFLIGTVLTIVFVGGLIVWIAWIYSASGFYSLKPTTGEPSVTSYSAPQPPATFNMAEKRYCPYCGAQISADSLYCPNCGRQIR
jgi:uncharacterized membrane protein